jgi:CHASE2 domain-containing sensor protein
MPELEIIDPIGNTLADFDVTDIAYTKIKGYKLHDNKNGVEINEEKADTNIVIVNVGEKNRAEIGMLINRITDCNPKAIGVDVIFKQPKTESPVVDTILSEAIKRSGKVILATKFSYDEDGNERGMVKSYNLFSDYAQNSYVNVVTDGTDSIARFKTCREFYPKHTFMGKDMNFFAVDLAAKLSPEKAKEFLNRNNPTEVINYLGNIGSYNFVHLNDVAKFQSIEHDAVLAMQFDPSLFKNKIVLLGFLGRTIGDQDLEDIFYTPLNPEYVGKSYPDMFGVVIHANIINMILNETYIDPVPTWIKVVFGIIVAYFSVVLLYTAFLAYPLMYGTLSKIIQFVLWISVLFVIVGIFYTYRIKYDADLAVVALLLAGDMVEIYHEIVLPSVIKLYRLLKPQKELVVTLNENN